MNFEVRIHRYFYSYELPLSSEWVRTGTTTQGDFEDFLGESNFEKSFWFALCFHFPRPVRREPSSLGVLWDQLTTKNNDFRIFPWYLE